MSARGVLDLFAGPGGWDVALAALGVRAVGVEWDAAACETRAAAGHLTIRADVSRYPAERFRGVWGLVASPPCPTFSTAGSGEGTAELPWLHSFAESAGKRGWFDPWAHHQWSDPRTPLVLEPLRWVEACEPSWVALEQVPGVLPLWEQYAAIWREQGYSTWAGVLNAADFGVPQTRRRAFVLASRARPVVPPEPTHGRDPRPGLFGTVLPWVSMAEALGWGYDERTSRTLDRRQRGAPTLDPAEVPSPTLTAAAIGKGVWTLHSRRDGPGWVNEHGERPDRTGDEPAPTLTAEAHRWAHDRPATAVCGDPRLSPPGFRGRPEDYDDDGTYTGKRSMDDAIKLTVRDALILQSFPPDYPVRGTRTKQFEQVGNAVPPLLAARVLDALGVAA